MWQTALDSWMAVTAQSGCWETEVISMHQVGRWLFLHLILLLIPYWLGGSIPNKVAQQMLDPPIDPPSRFPLWEGQSSIFCAGGYTDKDDSLGPPSPEGWQFFQPWSRWPLTWWTGSRNITCIQDPTCNALSLGGYWQCPHFDILFCTRSSGSPH